MIGNARISTAAAAVAAAAAFTFAGAIEATGSAPQAEIAKATEAMQPRLIALRRDLHEHPELGNRETRTGALLARWRLV